MKFIAKSRSFAITQKELEMAGYYLLDAIRNIRELAGLPMDKYPRDGMLEPADFAQRGIILAADAMGIDLGAEWGNQLDVREVG